MTTIIGRQTITGATLMADYQVSSESEMFISRYARKISKNWRLAYGSAGSGRLCDFIQYCWEPVQLDDHSEVNNEGAYYWLVSSLVPDLRKSMATEGFELGGDGVDLQMLIIVDGYLFQIESDGTVMHREAGLYGIGTGGSYALGAMAAGSSMDHAMYIAQDFDSYTSGIDYSPTDVSFDSIEMRIR
jgi:hypothetical protein